MKFAERFTKREIEVIERIAEGESSNEMAANMNIAVGTIRAHRKNILSKSGCRNITEVIAKWVREDEFKSNGNVT